MGSVVGRGADDERGPRAAAQQRVAGQTQIAERAAAVAPCGPACGSCHAVHLSLQRQRPLLPRDGVSSCLALGASQTSPLRLSVDKHRLFALTLQPLKPPAHLVGDGAVSSVVRAGRTRRITSRYNGLYVGCVSGTYSMHPCTSAVAGEAALLRCAGRATARINLTNVRSCAKLLKPFAAAALHPRWRTACNRKAHTYTAVETRRTGGGGLKTAGTVSLTRRALTCQRHLEAQRPGRHPASVGHCGQATHAAGNVFRRW